MVARLWIWESQYDYGQQRSTFMGAAPLKDAPYLAAYEEAEIAATMINYLKEAGEDTPDAVRLFFAVYCNYPITQAEFRILDKKHGYATYQLAGTSDRTAQVRLIYRSRARLTVSLTFLDDDTKPGPVEPGEETRQYKQYDVRGNQHIRVEWNR